MREVKSRPGSLRAEQASVTRQRIEAAARRRLAADGYGATTLRAIADEAGVAVQTVYAVFGSKAAILRSLRHGLASDAGADAAWAAALAAPDLDGLIGAFARSIRLRWETGADIVAIDGDAAHADPAIKPEIDAVLARRRQGIARIATAIVAVDPAAADPVTLAAAIDALTLPEAYLVLTRVHGWTADAYEAWLRERLADAARAPLSPS
ncbi:MAG: helix-turn-helix domain-containing protein [Candidatus Limnocylindrales bacterium]